MNVSAVRIGEKIKIRELQKSSIFTPSLKEPFVIEYKRNEFIVLFRYGVAVFWGLSGVEMNQFIAKISEFIVSPVSEPFMEQVKVKVGSRGNIIMPKNIEIAEYTKERVAIISEVLSRSVAMDYFEREVESVLTDFEDVTKRLAEKGKTNLSANTLLKKIGVAMNIQHLIVSQLAMLDKPAITWDEAELDKFYNALSVEYEIKERYATLSKKLDIILRDVEVIMNYLDNRHAHLLEIIVIALIAFETVILLFERFT